MFKTEYQLKEYSVVSKWISSKAVVLNHSEAAALHCSYQENIFKSPSFSMPAYWLLKTTILYENNFNRDVYSKIFWFFSEFLYIIDCNR